jgi:sulfatase modifying factor 1
MNSTRTLLTGILLASFSVGHAAAPLTNSIGMSLMPIRGGTFVMGQDGPQTDYRMKHHPHESDRADWDEKPVHKVIISRDFYLGTTEVTVQQYQYFDPSYRPKNALPDEAAGGISWYNTTFTK